jgi:shikimate kinase
MGTGKSAVGKILAEKLSYTLIDLDSLIEKEQKMSITEIFSKYGEAAFRDIEAELISRLSDLEKVVISTGGGAVLRKSNIENLRKNGVIICLTAKAETIISRVENSDERPLLKVDNPLQKIRELLIIREPYYKNADISIQTDGKNPEEIAAEILENLTGKI